MDVIIAPSGCKKLLKVNLPRPKDGQLQHFFYDEDNLALYEMVKFSEKYRSWFIDDLLCSDGHFTMLTKVDPLFIFLPHVMKNSKQNFRPLDDICQEFNSTNEVPPSDSTATSRSSENSDNKFSRLDYALAPGINWASICDTRDMDGDLFIRFSEPNTIRWLTKKHDRLMDSLRGEMGIKTSKATLMSYATDLISDYVPHELCEKFRTTVRSNHLMGPPTSKK